MALLGSWPSFQEETTIENMQKSKINYLPTIPKSPKYPLCNTYIIFLVDTMEVLELLYIFVHTDEQTSIRQISIWTCIKTNHKTFQTVDPEICLIFNFYKRVWEQLLRHILCMISQKKCSYHVLLTDQISKLQLFFVSVCDIINFEINLKVRLHYNF